MIIDDLKLVRSDPSLIDSVERVTEEMLNIAGINYLKELKNTDEQTQINLVRKHPILLAFIKEASENVCIAALEQDGFMLRVIDIILGIGVHQTRLMQEVAITQNPYALVYANWRTVPRDLIEMAMKMTNDRVMGFIGIVFEHEDKNKMPKIKAHLHKHISETYDKLKNYNIKISPVTLRDIILRNAKRFEKLFDEIYN